MRTSIQIGKIMGIPIKLHITFLLILPVFAYSFSVNPSNFGFSDIEPAIFRYTLSSLAAISLFACVLLHELGHSYVAKKHGTTIQGITLFLFGGVSSMEEIPRNPRTELKMAVAGPAVSLVIGSTLIILHEFLKTGSSYVFAEPILRFIYLVGFINIILCIFNLIPAFPMDGGRVLRAWFAERMSYIKATKAAAGIGKMFAILMGVFGFLTVSIGGFWFMLIAFFIYIGASEEEKSTEVSVILEGTKVKDIMSRNILTVSPESTVEELVDLMFKHKHMGYPVVENEQPTGIVTFNDVQKVPKEERKLIRVSQIMTQELITAKEDDDAIIALKMMTVNNIGRIIVKNDGKMTGIVSRTDLLRSVQILE